MNRKFRVVGKETEYEPLTDSEVERLSPVDIAHDQALESHSIELLSEFDQMMVKIMDKKRKDPLVALQLVGDMVNRSVLFSENVLKLDPKQGYLKKILEKVGHKYSHIQLLHNQGNQISLQTAVNVYKAWTGDTAERAVVFKQISLALLYILQTYFKFFAKSFKSKETQVEWKDTYDMFTSQLSDTVEGLQY